MVLIIWTLVILCALATSYVLQYVRATLAMTESLGEAESATDLQDDLISSLRTLLAVGAIGTTCVVLVLAFAMLGLGTGLWATYTVFLVTIFARFLWPAPESQYFQRQVMRAIARRHSHYINVRDLARAQALETLLLQAGIDPQKLDEVS
jgi:hypothetical protein